MIGSNQVKWLSAFRREEDGATTFLGLYFTMISLMMGGLAVDINGLLTHRTRMQAVTDAAAHAALYKRQTSSASDAIETARSLVETSLPSERYGEAVRVEDVEFGSWDPDTRVFTPNAGAKTAVRVRAVNTSERDNAFQTRLLRISGIKSLDMTTQSVFATHTPPCLMQGLVAADTVTVSSNNAFEDEFCLHSNQHVSLHNGNTFEEGTKVSMPDTAMLDIPGSGYGSNPGLESALTDGFYRLRVVSQIDTILSELESGFGDYVPSYISGLGPVFLSGNKIKPSDFVQGRVHKITCNGGGQVVVQAGTYSEVVLTTNCKLKFAQGVVLEDAIFATSNTNFRSMSAPSGLQLGRDDGCADGGGAVLVTKGGVDIPAKLETYGAQILATGDISFAANANGVEGVSMIAGGSITGTSNMTMGFCTSGGMEAAFEPSYFRMVR